MKRLRNWADIVALNGADALTAAETSLITACRLGSECILGDGARPEASDPVRNIRAELLRYLLLGGCEKCPVSEEGVRLRGAYIDTSLEMSFMTARGNTVARNCNFSASIDAVQSHFRDLDLTGSAISALRGEGIRVDGDMNLDLTMIGIVEIPGAVVGGHLTCTGAKFRGGTKDDGDSEIFALDAQRLSVGGHLCFNNGFTATQEINLAGAVVGGQLQCDGGRFLNQNGNALFLQGARIKQDVHFDDGFESKGYVNLAGARIGGDLNCQRSRFYNPGGFALRVDGAKMKGNLILSNGFTSVGMVSLAGIDIRGQLVCRNGRIYRRKKCALNAQGASVAQGVFIAHGFRVNGEMSFAGAEIGGQLLCSGCLVLNRGGSALNANSAKISGDAFFDDGFKSSGVVGLAGAEIRGALTCVNAHFKNNKHDAAIVMQGMRATALIWRNISSAFGNY